MPAVEKKVGPAPGEAFGGAAPIEEVLDQKDTPTPAYPPIWDEMMEMLKRGDPPTFVSARLHFGMLESVVSRIQQLQGCTVPEIAEVRLEVAEAIWVFVSHRLGGGEELRARLERVKTDLVAAQKERETICVEVDKLKKEGEAVEVKLKGAEQENSQLKKEKNELEVGFVAQKKELEAEYQKQVDEMYFFGYRCCMKKNGIMHDIPSLPSDDEDEILGGAFPVFLELPDSHFNCIFEDLSEDECSDLEGVGQCLTVVVGNRPLLIGSHLDGCTFPYFVRPVQVLSKFLAFVPLTLHDGLGHGHAYFHRDDCVHPVHKSERSGFVRCLCLPVALGVPIVKLRPVVNYNRLGNPESADDVLPNKLHEIFVFDASISFRLYPLTEIVSGNEQEFLLNGRGRQRSHYIHSPLCEWPRARYWWPSSTPASGRDVLKIDLLSGCHKRLHGEAGSLHPDPMCMLGFFRQGSCSEILLYDVFSLLAFFDSAADGQFCDGGYWSDMYGQQYGISLYVIRLGDLLDSPFIMSLEVASASTRFNPNIMASYSASLFDAENSNRMACSNCSPIRDCRRSPTLDPNDREAPSTYWGTSAMKSAMTYPFMDNLGWYSISYLLNSMAHFSILPDRFGLCKILRRGWLLSVHPVASASLSTRKKGCSLSMNRAMKRPSATSLSVPAVPTLHASRQITGASYRIASLMRHEWSPSFCLAMRDM
ncbi:hypothetical protein AAG906_036896 [Vitis piasezkii]